MSINLLESSNIFEDIFLPINLRKQASLINLNNQLSLQNNPNNEKIDVYFYRYIGFNNRDEYVRDLNRLNERLLSFGNEYLKFNKAIPLPYNMELTDRINNALSRISEIDLRNERGSGVLKSAGNFSITKDNALNDRLEEAFLSTMKLYAANEPIPTLSIEKNFIIKLLLWANEHIPRLFSSSPQDQAPKVLYYGEIKKHEVYFLVMLSQMGCDVLYINSESDADYLKVDKKGSYSKLKEFALKGPVDFEFKDIQVVKENKPIQTANKSASPEKNIETSDNVIVVLKNSTNIFEDIAFPLSRRLGYVGLPCPVLPIYFYRSIGFEGEDINAEDEFYNKLYSLDKKLANLGTGYVKFINHIPMPFNEEIDRVSNRFKRVFDKNYNENKNIIASEIVSLGILEKEKEPLMNKLINSSFERIMKLYLEKEPNINLGRLQNFIYKLIVWINRYYKQLFVNKGFKESPKILHYGDIKLHEVYFLIFLSGIGCDVLYVTTDEQKDKPFMELDPKEECSNLIVFEKTAPMQEFPEKERVIRKTTTAFNASRELENVLYSGDVGLFRPWQLSDYNVRPITLRTTYDELKLLWNENSKIRPEFKVENGVVYIPNLFAKINGTLENLEEYWMDYKQFARQQNVLELRSVPFTKLRFTRQEMFSMAYVLDNKGSINKEALTSSKFYRFSYLRTSLQNLLLEKLNELLFFKGFRRAIDNNFRLLIIMTIITMDEDILRLIETFDYPGNVPKLVIYNNLREPFSDEDSIVIAFLNSIGFDIVIFTPTNYNTIEQKLEDDIFDRFQLPSIQYDLQIPASVNNDKAKSFFSRILGI